MSTKINRRKTLSVYPDITEVEYGSAIESSDLNKQLRSIEESALRAILRGRELSSEVSRLQLGVIKSYQAMSNFVGSLQYIEDGRLYASTYDVETNVSSTSDIFYDTNYGYTSLNPIGSYSKIPRGEKYDGRVSPQVVIELDSVEVEPNSEIYDALDGTNKSFWLEEVTDEQHIIDIHLPPALTKRFNYIELYPFPLYGCTIDSVEYMPFRGGLYEDVTANIYGGNPLENNKGEAVKLYLSPKEYNGTVRVKVTPLDGYIGFSNIDIKFLDFDNTSKPGFIPFRGLEGKDDGYGITVNELTVDWYFDGPETMIISDETPIRMWLSVGDIDPVAGTFDSTAATFRHPVELADIRTLTVDKPLTINTGQSLVLEFQLKEHNVTTPVIRGAKITYVETP